MRPLSRRIVTFVGLPPGSLSFDMADDLAHHMVRGGWVPRGSAREVAEVVAEEGDWHRAHRGTVLEVAADPPGGSSFAGYLLWDVPAGHRSLLDRERHIATVDALLRVARAPLAVCADGEAFERSRGRHGPGGYTLNVGTYADGLEAAHFRMWFGDAWTAHFGRRRLLDAPCVEVRELGGGVFVQVLPLPEDWATADGRARIRAFTDHVGADSFFDPAHPSRTLSAPAFALPDPSESPDPLRLVGFFSELPHGDPHGPSLRAAMSGSAGPPDAGLVGYLQSGIVLVGTPGSTRDVLTGEVLAPPHVLTDGRWAWPADLSHYVARHGVRLDEEFLRHVRANGYRMPVVDPETLVLPSD